jgi:hypothetical protein
MWVVLKLNRKKLNFLKQDFKKKIGKDFIIYDPKIKVQKYKNNKLKDLELNILGDYIFCFHKNFKNKNMITNLQFCRGLKYFLNGCDEAQNEIIQFIEKLKSLENKNGFICDPLFKLKENSNYKFTSGPFVDTLFKIIELQKNKINILMGNIKTTINKKEYIFKPI